MVKKLKMNKTNEMNKTMKMMIALTLMSFMIGGVIAQSYSSFQENLDSATNSEEGSPTRINIVPVPMPRNPSALPKGFVSLELYPEREVANLGEWTNYKLVILDNHPRPVCRDADPYVITEDDGSIPLCNLPQYNYELIFESNDLDNTLEYRFDDDSVIMSSGEKKIIKFSVLGNKRGVNKFTVTVQDIVKSPGGKAKVNGYLIVNDDFPSRDRQFFFGDGFALNSDQTKGVLVDLKILIDENSVSEGKLKGKGIFDGSVYKIDGEYNKNSGSDTNVYFGFTGIDSDDVRMKFYGNIQEFGHFSLLKGRIESVDGKTYMLTAFSRNEIIMFQEVEIVSSGASKSTNTGINEIVSVVPKKIVETESVRIDQNDLSELEEIYIRTVKVSKSKIFYFVPNPWGKKVLELEVTIGDKVYKETIKESASENIEGYRIEVGSLEDEDNIELNFKKA
jgi:hypothetical protein